MKKGFSLIEVVVASLMVGISMTTLYNLQAVLSRGVGAAHAFVFRLSFIESYFVQADREKYYTDRQERKQTIEDPEMVLTYRITDPESQGLPASVVMEVVEARWPGLYKENRQLFKRARFVTQEKKNA